MVMMYRIANRACISLFV